MQKTVGIAREKNCYHRSDVLSDAKLMLHKKIYNKQLGTYVEYRKWQNKDTLKHKSKKGSVICTTINI